MNVLYLFVFLHPLLKLISFHHPFFLSFFCFGFAFDFQFRIRNRFSIFFLVQGRIGWEEMKK